jgi:arginine decarboxylase
MLADVTCDSDGRIDHFADLNNEKRVLEVHAPGESQYLLGAFLVGAYQEILGDLHNLFGDTHALHVKLTDQGYRIANVVEGDTMAEVLSYIEYNRSGMVESVRSAAEKALERGEMTLAQAYLVP